MNRLLLATLMLLALVAWAGCATPLQPAQPPSIRYGEDICDECQMIISEERYAAAYTTTGGHVRRFDDIGGMLNYAARHEEAVAAYWVHDVSTGEWLDAGSAYFVLNSAQLTPMGHGIVACADEDSARALAYGVPGAEVIDFAALQARRSPAAAGLPTEP